LHFLDIGDGHVVLKMLLLEILNVIVSVVLDNLNVLWVTFKAFMLLFRPLLV